MVPLSALGTLPTATGAFTEIAICDAQRYLVAARKLSASDVDGFYGPKSKAAMAEYVRTKGLTPVKFGEHANYRGTSGGRMRIPNAYLAVLPAKATGISCGGTTGGGTTGGGTTGGGGGATTGGGSARTNANNNSNITPDGGPADPGPGPSVDKPSYSESESKPIPWGMIAAAAGGFVVLA
jgi:hypothetical protein